MELAEKHQAGRRRPLSRLISRLLGPTLVALLVIGFYWKLALTDEYLWLDSPDLANQVLPWLQFQAGEWRAGRIPLWDPYQWGGQPLVGQMQPGAASPLNWILFLAPLRNGWLRQTALNWYFVGIHLVAAWMAYWFCRDRRLSRPAAVFSALAFSVSGWVGTTAWPQMLNGAIWAPAVFLFLFRAAEGIRPVASSLLCGFFLGLAWLSGHHQAPMFLTLAVGVAWLFHLAKAVETYRKISLYLLILLLSMASTSSLQILPAIEYGRLAVRWAGDSQPTAWGERLPYRIHQDYSMGPETVPGILTPMLDQNVNPIAGVTILCLAVIGVVSHWQCAWVRLLTLVSSFGFVLALGTFTPLHGILYALFPVVEKARSPLAAIFIFNLGLSVLSGCGISTLATTDSATLARRVGWAAYLTAVVFILVTLIAQISGKGPAARGFGITATAAVAVGSLLLAASKRKIGNFALVGGLVVAMSAELTVGGLQAGLASRYSKIRLSVIDRLAVAPQIVDLLRGLPRPFRISVNSEDVPFNFGDWHGIETTGGYLASLTRNVHAIGLQSPGVERLMGARYHLSSKPAHDEQRLVLVDQSGLKLFENPGAFPRAWVVHRLAGLDTQGEIEAFVNQNPDALLTTAPIRSPAPSLPQCPATSQVRFVDKRPDLTVLEANLGCRGMVVLSDVYYPGWEAQVDGKRAEIHEVYGFLRGVVVEGGEHRIEMSYRPKSVLAGGILTATGALFALLAALTGFRNRKSAILTT